MAYISVDTDKGRECANNIRKKSKYFSLVSGIFYSGSFGSNSLPSLSNHLSRIRETSDAISRNLNKIASYTDEYVGDLEGIENKITTGSGFVNAGNAYTYLSKIETPNLNFSFGETKLFELVTFLTKDEQGKNIQEMVDKIKAQEAEAERLRLEAEAYAAEAGARQAAANREAFSSLSFLEKTKALLATGATGVCAFVEGVANIGEQIMDCGALIVADVQSACGYEEASKKTAAFISEEWTKKGYNSVLDKSGIGDYSLADPNGKAMRFISSVGTAAGMITLSVVTGGASVPATLALNATIAFATTTGKKAEDKLQEGATLKEASVSAFTAGGISAVAGLAGGSLDKFGRLAGQSSNALNVVKYTSISGGVGAATPVIQHSVETIVDYENRDNKELGYWDIWKETAKEDGLLGEVLWGAATKAGGTFANAVAGSINIKNIKAEARIKANESVTEELQEKAKNDAMEVLQEFGAGKIKSTEVEQQFTEALEIDPKDFNLKYEEKVGLFNKVIDVYMGKGGLKVTDQNRLAKVVTLFSKAIKKVKIPSDGVGLEEVAEDIATQMLNDVDNEDKNS